MQNYAVVVLDATGSMSGQEERVITSANEYVTGLPESTHLTLFMFDSERWITFFNGDTASWKKMKMRDYETGSTTPLFDAIGKAIGHADRLVSDGDRVMMMVDTDGYENASHEHTQESIKALVEARKKAGWAFMFMSAGLDRADAETIAYQGASLGMPRLGAVRTSRRANFSRARDRTRGYFERGELPVDEEILVDLPDESIEPDPEPAGAGRSSSRTSSFRSAPFRPERGRQSN